MTDSTEERRATATPTSKHAQTHTPPQHPVVCFSFLFLPFPSCFFFILFQEASDLVLQSSCLCSFELLSDMYKPPQVLRIFPDGGACVNANVRVRRTAVSMEFSRLVAAVLICHFLSLSAAPGCSTSCLIWCCCERVCAENLLLWCACVKGRLRVNSVAN